eukprot:CAMPEP_0117858896 /NCGR_PEP_ID=MMETSP0950-20121206/2795_1 /TAXON_ID=44440 /ORGANISM="Chattonella subsalsa, Strain CCMP2191" /LENGTH=342 /DNA_ID=CAMNT_0005708635 /DNA_START=593 /DNA_END=1621 /DNA_ORIENTATION=-
MVQQVMSPPALTSLRCIMEIDPFSAVMLLLLLLVIGLLATLLYVAKRTVCAFNTRIDCLSAQLDILSNQLNDNQRAIQQLKAIASPKPSVSFSAMKPQQQHKQHAISIAQDIAASAIMDFPMNYRRTTTRKPRGHGRGRANNCHRTGEYTAPIARAQTLMDTGSNAHIVNNYNYFIPGSFIHSSSGCPINTFAGISTTSVGFGIVGLKIDAPGKGIIFTTAELVEGAPFNVFSPGRFCCDAKDKLDSSASVLIRSQGASIFVDGKHFFTARIQNEGQFVMDSNFLNGIDSKPFFNLTALPATVPINNHVYSPTGTHYGVVLEIEDSQSTFPSQTELCLDTLT